jgi:hypothetical protein
MAVSLGMKKDVVAVVMGISVTVNGGVINPYSGSRTITL